MIGDNYMYDCPPDHIDCMDRLMRALTEELRRDMLHNQRRGSGKGGNGSGGLLTIQIL